MACTKLILSATVFALSACVTAPPPPSPAEPDPIADHQDPSNPNPEALPTGVLEWTEYACAIEDPAERAKAIKEGEERGWAIGCLDKPATDAGPG